MQHPIITSANVKVTYDLLLERADNHRRIKHLDNEKQGIIKQILTAVSSTLHHRKKPHVCCQVQPILDMD